MSPFWKRWAVAVGLLLATAVYVELAPFGEETPLRGDLRQLPAQLGDWTQVSGEGMEEFNLFQMGEAQFSRTYRNDRGEAVSLYVSYLGKFRYGHNFFEGRNPSPGKKWNPQGNSEIKINVRRRPLKINEIRFRRGGEQMLVTYWYFMGDADLTEKGKGRIKQALNVMLNRRTDVALVKVSSSYHADGEKNAHHIHHEKFIQEMVPFLIEFLPYNLE